MRTILVLSLIAASFAFVPGADAACDPVQGAVCVSSYSYGTCSDGYQGNWASADNEDAGYVGVGAGTYCSSSPGSYENHGLTAGVSQCDPMFTNCTQVGVHWSSGSYNGEFCESGVYVITMGAYNPRDLPVCDTVGDPPVIPSLGLP